MKELLSDRVNRKALKGFIYVERMSGKRLTKRLYDSEVEGIKYIINNEA